jgi:hypothetical protein
MQKFKIISLIIVIFALSIMCLPPAIAKADNVNGVNINEGRDNSNLNQSDVNQAPLNVNQGQDNNGKLNGALHRSAVATFVQNLLNVANKEQGGIGDQVRAVAQAQNDVVGAEATAIDKIQNRSGVKTFFIGTDYKNIGMLRSEMVKTRNQIDQLNALLDKTTSAETKATLTAQIQALTLEQQKINNFVNINESKFSLLGWFVKLFY